MFEILSFSQLQRGWMNSMLRLSEIMVPSGLFIIRWLLIQHRILES